MNGSNEKSSRSNNHLLDKVFFIAIILDDMTGKLLVKKKFLTKNNNQFKYFNLRNLIINFRIWLYKIQTFVIFSFSE